MTPADFGTTANSIVAIAEALTRPDVVAQVEALQARVGRPDTYVVVLGEFKQGKSSLLNALLDTVLCPADDDLATSAVTIVRHADELQAALHIAGNDEPRPVSPGAARVAAISGTYDEETVESVEFGVPTTITASGITLVDTPGVGGLRGGHTIATATFLPFADAVLFVSDATAEWTATELEWFRTATERCPVVIPVMTKTDLCPAWRTVLQRDTDVLTSLGSKSSIIACSASAYDTGTRLDDADLVTSSNLPLLRSLLTRRVTDPARERALTAATARARTLVRSLMDQVRSEFTLASEPDGVYAAQLRDEQARLQHLRGAGSKWSQVLNDAAGDIANASSFQFRGAMRTLGQSLDARVEALQSADDWSAFSATFQHDMADAVATVFAEIDRQFDELRLRLYEVVADEAVSADRSATRTAVDVSAFFATSLLDANEATRKGTAMQAVRSAQSGLMVFGFLGQMLPAAAAALLLSSPITIALSGYFAGKAVLDIRKRAVSTRRAQLKQGVRKVIDDAQFELGNRISELNRLSTRRLRDEITEAINLALLAHTEALEHAKQQHEADTTTRTTRTAELRRHAEQLKSIEDALSGIVNPPRGAQHVAG
jgi:signal recognition particle receptor subunit beta